MALLRLFAGSDWQALSRDSSTGLSDLASAEPGIALARLADALRNDEPARAMIASSDPKALTIEALPDGPTKAGLVRFLEDFGHRGTREAEIAEPRWREDPSLLFRTLSLLAIDGTAAKSLRGRDTKVGHARLRAEDAVNTRVPLAVRPFLRPLVRRVQHLVRMRESLRSDVTEVLGLFREVALEVSHRVEVQEPEAGADAAFFLTVDELHGVMQGGSRTSPCAFSSAGCSISATSHCRIPPPLSSAYPMTQSRPRR